MKYTLSQYVHDQYRLQLIAAERLELRQYIGRFDWALPRLEQIMEERSELVTRTTKFEKHPNNRGG